MTQFIDRRQNSKNKSAVNRQRFIKRFQQQIKRAVSRSVNDRNITNIEQGDDINIPAKDILEPKFNYGVGGKRIIILPGNREFMPGDKIKRPPKEKEQEIGGASNQGEGDDNFVFKISREEFLNIFFEDLALPNLIKKRIAQTNSFKHIRSGFSMTGTPANINIVRSLRCAMKRRFAFGVNHKRKVKALEDELQLLLEQNASENKLELIKAEIMALKNKINKIPFIDPIDLRYNNKIQQIMPSTRAVMFCIMDVSGSMDEAKKDIAKRFFILLYLFLTRTYEKTELVFIRHHTAAKEVNEHDFFYSRETGGTVVSSALELMRDIIKARYSGQEWNIYGAQASDGDNWNNDSPKCGALLREAILPFLQYYAYVEIMPRQHQSLWEEYKKIYQSSSVFAMQHLSNAQDIYPVFRELFKRQNII